MLEARSHNKLKQLLKRATSPWPHHLTLSRLVARSLRRKDQALIKLQSGLQDVWWMGVLVPLCIEPCAAVLVLSDQQKHRFFHQILTKLQFVG